MKQTFLCLILLFFFHNLLSQKDATVSLLTVNDGLSQGMIYDILQSKDGFIWIATKDGLNRYDGSRFKVYSPDPFNPYAIANSEVKTIYEDSRGWLWLATIASVEIFDPKTERFFHLQSNGKSISNSWIGDFSESKDGSKIWYTNRKQVWKITVTNDMIENAIKKNNPNIQSIAKIISLDGINSTSGIQVESTRLLLTNDNKLILGTSNGLYYIDIIKDEIIPYLSINNCHILRLAKSKTGKILAKGNVTGEYRQTWILIDGEDVQYYDDTSPKNAQSRLIFDDKDFLWTYREQKLQKWNLDLFFNNGKPESEIIADPLSGGKQGERYCTAFCIDRSGMFWVGTNGYGVLKINISGDKFKTYLPKVSHRTLIEDSRQLLYSLSVPDKKIAYNNYNQIMPNNDIAINSGIVGNKMTFDQNGNFWTMDDHLNELFRFDTNTKIKQTFPFTADGIICNRDGNIIGVNDKGILQMDTKSFKIQFYKFNKPQRKVSEYSNFIYEDNRKVLWIFGYDGLIKAIANASGYQFTYYISNVKNKSSLSMNTVLSVVDDPTEPSKYLWIGTKGGGLNRLEKETGIFKHYNKTNGLPDNVIYGVLAEDVKTSKGVPSDGILWMSTNKGICRFNVKDETIKNFTVNDGLQDNEFNSSSYLKTKTGALIFGGINGINIIYPDSLKFNNHTPQIQIVGLKVNNSNYDLKYQSTYTFSYDQNLLNFEFAALEYTNPSQNQYRYQLVGVDKNWVDLGYKNNIQFANLAPGDYTFKVMGSNNDGLWSKDAAELKFTIKSPWYATWWAYLFYLSLLILVIWYYYKYKLNQKLEHQETTKLREMDEFKSRFFTNITHEFRTPLTVILGMSDQLANEEKDQNCKKKIGLIKRNGDNLLRLVNQILDLSKLESNTLKLHYIQGDVLAYMKYIAESLHSLANAQNLMLRVESDQVKIEMDYDPERLLQIMYNLLSNAVKFTPSGGKVIVRADQKDNWLYVSVTDTGAGIEEKELPYLFERFFQAKNQEHSKAGGTGIGLSLTCELVKAMNGEITVESKVGVGTKFMVKLPITNNAVKENSIDNYGTEFKKELSQISGISSVNNQAKIQNDNTSLPNILLIEDNPDVVEYLTSCLQHNFKLDFAFNGQAGIDKALETIPDIIVSDVMMPIKDGFDVLESLKNDKKTSHIPIILLTAKADIQSRLTGLRKGADAYLAKPFHQEELIVTIENLLESRRLLQVKYQQNNWIIPETKETSIPDIEDAFLQKFRAVVQENISNSDFEMPQLERALSMSRSQIYRKIKALTDKSPSLLIRSIRLHHGRHLLLTTKLTVSEIAYEVGYTALNNFSDAYLEEFGERPLKSRG